MNRAFVVPDIPAKDSTNDIDSFRVPRSEPISVPNMNLRSTPREKICTDEGVSCGSALQCLPGVEAVGYPNKRK